MIDGAPALAHRCAEVGMRSARGWLTERGTTVWQPDKLHHVGRGSKPQVFVSNAAGHLRVRSAYVGLPFQASRVPFA